MIAEQGFELCFRGLIGFRDAQEFEHIGGAMQI